MNRFTLTTIIVLAYSAILSLAASPLSSVCIIKLAWL